MIKWKNRADEFFKDKFTSIARKSIFDSIEKFLSNEKSDIRQTFLLDIIFLMDWKSQSDIILYLHDCVYRNLTVGNFVLKFKESAMSSSNQIILKLLENGYIFSDNVLNTNNIKQFESLRGRSIDLIIMDDFSGTGTTLWKAIKKVTEYCTIRIKIIIYAWTEKCIDYLSVKCSESAEIESFDIIKSANLIRRYDDKLSRELLDYVESISYKIEDTRNRYGYKNTGTMISLDGLSPNNNLPIIWKSDIQIDDRSWTPLLNRDFKTEVINKFKDIVYNKYKKEFFKTYKENIVKISNLKEFQIMYILYSFKYSTHEFLKTNFGFDTIEQSERVLMDLKERGLINQSEGVFEIIDENILKSIIEIDSLISRDILKLIREDSKNISYEFVGKRNFEYNKDK